VRRNRSTVVVRIFDVNGASRQGPIAVGPCSRAGGVSLKLTTTAAEARVVRYRWCGCAP
jgi:hypothetical protein